MYDKGLEYKANPNNKEGKRKVALRKSSGGSGIWYWKNRSHEERPQSRLEGVDGESQEKDRWTTKSGGRQHGGQEELGVKGPPDIVPLV